MVVSTVRIDMNINIPLLTLANATSFVSMNNVILNLGIDYTQLLGYDSSDNYSGSSVLLDNINVIPNGYTFAIGSMPPDYVPTINIYPKSLLTPSLPANPPVSGTVYQNTTPYGIEIDLPVYATTSATAGYVTVAKGASSSSLTTIGNQYVSGDTSDTSEQIIRLRVPAGWYYEFTASGVTFGTASVFAD